MVEDGDDCAGGSLGRWHNVWGGSGCRLACVGSALEWVPTVGAGVGVDGEPGLHALSVKDVLARQADPPDRLVIV